MNKYAALAILPFLLKMHLTIHGAGASVTIPGAFAAAAAIVLACAVLAWLTVRELHRFTSCPHPRAVTTGGT
jgi:hypothetical protein